MTYYKPYSIEWTRKRYLAEAIQQYFDSGVDVNVIVNDIQSILKENADDHKILAEKYQNVIDELD
jgi:hypothetical protein